MSRHNLPILVALLIPIVCAACGESRPGDWKDTVPVKGRVLVDGKPAAMLSIECVDVAGLDKENPTMSAAMTNEDGEFEFGTYVKGDGVPEGEYVLTFEWGTLDLWRHQYKGDKFNGRYHDPKTSTTTFTATAGEPVDLGDINLTLQ
jgi:5-hydroxyisourate hydrolase-like protein (transthyretin family)